MKKITLYLSGITMFLTMLLAIPALQPTTSAVDLFKPTCTRSGYVASGSTVCKDVKAQQTSTTNPIIKILRSGILLVSYVVGLAAIVGILIGAIRMVTANGDSNAVASAKSTITYSLIGILIAVLAQAMVAYVLARVN